jgi:hypothetical protein
MMITTIVPPANVTAQNGQGELLPDDYIISGADGRLVDGVEGKWLFEFESGQIIELLKSATLEKMVADANQRSVASYRLWGKVTKFEGKNYLFPSYFVGLRKLDRPESEPNKQTGEIKQQTVNAPNDILNIPEEIVAQLATSEVLPATEATPALELKQDTIFANRVGRVIEEKGKYLFRLDGFGQGIEQFTTELLPCQTLDDAVKQVRDEPNPVRFNVAGILTKYEGRQFLLLQKATRIYSYGNFGR